MPTNTVKIPINGRKTVTIMQSTRSIKKYKAVLILPYTLPILTTVILMA